MKDQKAISTGQIAVLFLSFLSGSSIVYIPNPMVAAAGNMAWLSLSISTLLGLWVLVCVLYLYRCNPKLTFIEYTQQSLGRWFSALIIIPFILMLFLMFSYIVMGIGSFFVSTMMVETPLYVFHFLIILTAALTVRAGIEVMARMFLLLLSSMYGFVIIILLLAIPLYHPDQLLPLFPEGINPVLHGTFFSFGFPFAELVLFAMILPFVRKDGRSSLRKWMYGATVINGIALFLVIISAIMILGPLAGERKFSLYAMARLITIGDFLEGIESIVGFTLIAGSYMKATIVLFILNLALTKFLKLKNDKLLIYLISFICFLLSITMFRNEAEFNEAVNVVWPLITVILGVIPVHLITVITLIKRWNANLRKQQ